MDSGVRRWATSAATLLTATAAVLTVAVTPPGVVERSAPDDAVLALIADDEPLEQDSEAADDATMTLDGTRIPDPLVLDNGDTVDSVQTWEKKRRPELLEAFADHVYGQPLPDPTDHLSVTSQAISAGRLTEDGFGPSGVSRVEQEILEQPNLGGVILLQGINDLGSPLVQGPQKTADDLIAAYKDVAERVHDKGVPIYIGTLTPAGSLARPAPYGLYSTPNAVAERHKTNEWIRTEGREVFDGVIDFDAEIKDPLIRDWIALQYDALDNLHPNQAGYKKMAESIPQEYLDEIATG